MIRHGARAPATTRHPSSRSRSAIRSENRCPPRRPAQLPQVESRCRERSRLRRRPARARNGSDHRSPPRTLARRRLHSGASDHTANAVNTASIAALTDPDQARRTPSVDDGHDHEHDEHSACPRCNGAERRASRGHTRHDHGERREQQGHVTRSSSRSGGGDPTTEYQARPARREMRLPRWPSVARSQQALTTAIAAT